MYISRPTVKGTPGPSPIAVDHNVPGRQRVNAWERPRLRAPGTALVGSAMACLALALGACGTTGPTAASPVKGTPRGNATPASTEVTYLGPLTMQVDYDGDHHVHLAPPLSTPALQWTVACNQSHYSCGPQGGKAAVVELVSYSDDQYGDATTHRPFHQDVLAYVVLWHGVGCLTIGPPGAPTPDPNMRCDDVLVVDAMSGVALAGYQFSIGSPSR